MRFLCRLGFHKWQFRNETEVRSGERVEIYETRCTGEGCKQGHWRAIDIDTLPPIS